MEPVTTLNGYDMFEVVSAFQKEIRRCNEENAMYWGVELEVSGFTAYAWKRMIVMSTEDIGLANPVAPLIINSLHEQYKILSEAKNDRRTQCRLPYVQAILYLVNSPKSRHTDWALNYYFDSHLFVDTKMKEIPNYALDIHNRRGKILGKTINDFFNEGSFLNKHKPIENEEFYKSECQRRWNDKVWDEKAVAAKRSIEALKAAKYKTYNPKKQADAEAETQGSLFD